MKPLSLAFGLLFFANVYSEEVLVSSERIEKNYRSSTSSIESFGEYHFKKSSEDNVADFLKKNSTLQIHSSGSYGKAATIFLRGTDNRHTLILLDGIPINDSTSIGGAARLEFVKLTNVKSIEVLKGSQGVLYGSHAIGGVISIKTKNSGEKQASWTGSYGSYDNKKQSFVSSGSKDRLSYAFSGNWQDVEGISSYNEKRTVAAEKDSYSQVSFSSNLRFEVDAESALTFSSHINNSKYLYDNLNADDPDAVANYKSTLLAFKYERKVFEDLEMDLKISEYKVDRFLHDDFGDYPYISSTKRIDSHNRLDYSDSVIVQFGFDYQNEKASALSSFLSKDVKNERYSLFANNTIQLSNLILEQGIRYNTLQYFEDETNYKLALNYQLINELVALKTSFSTGFKAPSLYQTHSVYGNKNLEAEKSKSYDVSLYATPWKSGEFELTYFNIEYEDYINTKTIAPSVYQYHNIESARINGFELGFKTAMFNDFLYNLSISKIKAVDETNHRYLYRRPKIKLNESLTYFVSDDLELKVSYNYIGRRTNTDGAELGGYSLIDLYSSYKLDKSSLLSLSVGNILNREYEEIPPYGTPGTNYNISYRYDF